MQIFRRTHVFEGSKKKNVFIFPSMNAGSLPYMFGQNKNCSSSRDWSEIIYLFSQNFKIKPREFIIIL